MSAFSGGGGWGSLPSKSSGKKKKKDGFFDKGSNNKWIPDAVEGAVDSTVELGGNFVDDIKALSGIPRGMLEVGKAITHDVGKAATGGKGQYRSDDILGMILDSYKHVYGPLARGDFETFGKRVYEHPLGPVLDVAALFSGGGALLGKAGKLAATKGGSVGGAKLAGYRPALAGEGTARGIDVAGKTFVPRSMSLKGTAGKARDDFQLSSNPWIRARQELVGKLSEKAPNAKFIGANSRIAHRERLDSRLEGAARKAQSSAAKGKLAGHWSKQHEAAYQVLMGDFESPAQLVDFYKGQQGNLRQSEDVLPALKEAAKAGDKNAARALYAHDNAEVFEQFLSTRIKAMESPKTAKLVANPPRRLAAAVEAGKVLADRGADLKLQVEQLRGGGPERLAEVADELKRRGSLEKRLAGIDGDGGTYRPHTSKPRKGRRGQEVRTQGLPANMRNNEGMNFPYAADDPNIPRPIINAINAAEDYTQQLSDTQRALSYAKPMLDPTDRAEDFIRLDKNSEVGKFLGRADDAMDQMRVMFGDSPQLEQFQRQIMDQFVERFGDDGAMYVPKQIHDALIGQARNSAGFLRRLNKDFNGVWRAAVLALRPAWMVNNAFGALFFLLSSQSVLATARGLVMSSHGTERGKAIGDLMRGTLDAGFGNSTASYKDASRIVQGLAKPARGMSRFNAWAIEDPARKARFYELMREPVARVRKLNPGMSWAEAARLIMDEDPKAIFHLQEKVLDDLGDFRNLGPKERMARELVPFYSWIKVASKRMAHSAADDPARLLGFYNLGKLGVQINEEEYGALPSYLQGAIPAPEFLQRMLGGDKDNPVLIPTAGLNPAQTPIDLLGMFGGLFGEHPVGGGNPLANLGPVPKSVIEGFTNKQLFGGYPVMRGVEGKYAQKIGKQLLLSTPQSQAISKLYLRPPATNPLYEASLLSEVLKYLGVGARKTSLDVAHQRALEEQQAGAARPY